MPSARAFDGRRAQRRVGDARARGGADRLPALHAAENKRSWWAPERVRAAEEANIFASPNSALGFYANCAIAWVVATATDIMINKYLLGLPPKETGVQVFPPT
ncbi:hypothetical protein AB0H34_20960 [Saccharopolyspora shandongensis]|uniref:hypothetical protein n=1 Tax=Saccharopolyspora shandongensis TaxID=418495 RepID=UPI0033CD8B89